MAESTFDQIKDLMELYEEQDFDVSTLRYECELERGSFDELDDAERKLAKTSRKLRKKMKKFLKETKELEL